MYLYIISSGDYSKVGITTDYIRRFKEYVSHNPECELHFLCKFPNKDWCKRIETKAIKELRTNTDIEKRADFFKCTPLLIKRIFAEYVTIEDDFYTHTQFTRILEKSLMLFEITINAISFDSILLYFYHKNNSLDLIATKPKKTGINGRFFKNPQPNAKHNQEEKSLLNAKNAEVQALLKASFEKCKVKIFSYTTEEFKNKYAEFAHIEIDILEKGLAKFGAKRQEFFIRGKWELCWCIKRITVGNIFQGGNINEMLDRYKKESDEIKELSKSGLNIYEIAKIKNIYPFSVLLSLDFTKEEAYEMLDMTYSEALAELRMTESVFKKRFSKYNQDRYLKSVGFNPERVNNNK